jgi:hypothetical protein
VGFKPGCIVRAVQPAPVGLFREIVSKLTKKRAWMIDDHLRAYRLVGVLTVVRQRP